MNGSLVSPATRQRVRDLATPIALGFGRLGLTPNALTVIGFLGTCVAAYAAANLSWLLAGVLVLAFGIFDLFDGTLARATGQASTFGAFLDSTLDRAGEALVYIGIAAGCLAANFRSSPPGTADPPPPRTPRGRAPRATSPGGGESGAGTHRRPPP